MDKEERTVAETPEQEDADEQSTAITRRQFLIGAGAGLVVGAAGAAGVITLVSPKQGETTVVTGQVGTLAASTLPPTMRQVTLDIDGKKHDVIVDVRMSLWEVMTYQLGMATSNLGCDRAQCGACTVAVDGRAVNGCTVLAARLGRGQKIQTVASLSKGTRPEDLHPIQKAFWNEGGFQCGICTRGFIMSTYALLTKNSNLPAAGSPATCRQHPAPRRTPADLRQTAGRRCPD